MKIFFTLLAIVLSIFWTIYMFQKNHFKTGTDFYSIEKFKSEQYSIITIDTQKSEILFGWIDYHKKDAKNFSEFNRHYAGEFLKKIQKILPQTHLVINGQFFNAWREKTHMSFPLKSNGKIINDYMDNDISKRTLLQKSTWEFVLYDWFQASDLKDDTVKELIVGFSPEVDASSWAALWRNYIILDQNRLVFFLANAKTQAEMQTIIEAAWYSLKDALMLDWWPSAQYATIHDQKTYYGDWEVPQFFVIGEK